MVTYNEEVLPTFMLCKIISDIRKHNTYKTGVSFKIWSWCKIGPCQIWVIIWKKYVGHGPKMLDTIFTGNILYWSSYFDHVTSIMLIKFHFHVLKSLKRIFLLKIDKSFWGSYFIVLKLLFICKESWAKSGEDIDLGQLYTCIYSKLSASTNFLVTVYKSFWGILYLLFTTEKPKLLKMILP